MLYELKDHECFAFLAREFERWGDVPFQKTPFTQEQLTVLMAVTRAARKMLIQMGNATTAALVRKQGFVARLPFIAVEPDVQDPSRSLAFLATRLAAVRAAGIDFMQMETDDVVRYSLITTALEGTLMDVFQWAEARLRNEYGATVRYQDGPWLRAGVQ